MKTLTTVLACISLAVPVCAQSAEANKKDPQPKIIDAALADPFFSDTSLAMEFKNYWKYLKEDEANPKEVHSAWGQGFSVDYQSGYFMDFIGVDAVYYGAVKLGASDYFNTRGILYNNGTGNHKRNAEGYSKFGQRNIKIKHDVADVTFNARWGWQRIKNIGVLSTSTRLSPTTYSGWTGSVGYQNLTVRGLYVESSMDRNSPDKKQFATNTGSKINHIVSGDLLWKSALLDLSWGYGESDNYLRRHILLSEFKPVKSLHIGSQLYATHALSEYKAMPAGKRDFDDDAWHFALDAIWKGEGWGSKWGIGYTDAQKQHQVGFYPRHMSKQSRGTFVSMAYAGSDYMRDGELVLSNISDYMLTPTLTIGLAGSLAQFNYRGNHVRTGEINFFSRWAPVHPNLKNLIVWGMFGPGWSYKTAGGRTPKLVNGRYQRAHTLAGEVIVEYKFSLF